jgi:hypothetical protein
VRALRSKPGVGSGIDLAGVVSSFAATELERLAGCLDRLLPHVQPDGVAITGGVAIQLGMAALGLPDLVGSLADARAMVVGGHTLVVLPLERIFEHKVQTLARATASAPIDPKHVRDTRALGEVLGQQPPDVAPEALAADVYGIDADGYCERCELSRHPSRPPAPKDRVFELLGWERHIAADHGH